MHPDLRYLVHFYNDPRHLFKTITMAGEAEAEVICAAISAYKGWFWMRFSPAERAGYLRRRRFVEDALYTDYTREYGPLKEKIPVFFYLIPNLTAQKALEMARQRAAHGETQPHVLLVELAGLPDTTQMTFTLGDSHAAYWQRIRAAGLAFGGETNVPALLPDHNRVFPFARLAEIHAKYAGQEVRYEVQVWDYALLEKMSVEFLGDEETGMRPV